jgi:hypothetical protein
MVCVPFDLTLFPSASVRWPSFHCLSLRASASVFFSPFSAELRSLLSGSLFSDCKRTVTGASLPVRVAVVGRMGVGKSSVVTLLLSAFQEDHRTRQWQRGGGARRAGTGAGTVAEGERREWARRDRSDQPRLWP